MKSSKTFWITKSFDLVVVSIGCQWKGPRLWLLENLFHSPQQLLTGCTWPLFVESWSPQAKYLILLVSSIILLNYFFRMYVNISSLLIGTSVELTNNSSQTPLFCAAYCGHLDIVKLLLKLGADPNRRCSINCCTPVHAACWSGNQSLITSLLIAGILNNILLNSEFC